MYRNISWIPLVSMLFWAGMATAQSVSNADPDFDISGDEVVVLSAPRTIPASARVKKPFDSAELSEDFAQYGLQAAITMRAVQNKITFAIHQGFPLNGYWMTHDLDRAEQALRLAALSASNRADRQVLQELVRQNEHMRAWSNSLAEGYRTLSIAEYYMSPSGLDHDETFHKISGCSESLLATLSSRRLAENSPCD